MNIGSMTRRFIQRGWDEKEMGRWVWCRYRGKKNKIIRIITVYSPTRNEGKGCSVYSQQRRIMLEDNDDRCPIKAFWEDLYKSLEDWNNQGDYIIIGGDFNTDITNQELEEKFKDYGLINPLRKLHPTLKPPNTHKDGTKTIDAIFCSE